jgi:hypothetical protein
LSEKTKQNQNLVLAEGAQGRDTETQETRAGQGTPVAGSFVFLGIPFLLVTGRGQVRYVADGARGARGASSAAVAYPDNQLRSTSRGALSALSAGEVLARLSARLLRALGGTQFVAYATAFSHLQNSRNGSHVPTDLRSDSGLLPVTV